MPSRPLVATVATFLVLLAGCSEKTGGSPSANDQPTAPTTEQSTEETTSSEPSTGSGLADLQPCDLVDASALAALQLTGGEEDEIAGARRCQWHREGATVNDLYTVSLGLWDEDGLGDLNAPQKQETNIGSHAAVTFVDSVGNCGVGIAVTDTSRVETSAVGGNQELACQLANQLATAVEPKLP